MMRRLSIGLAALLVGLSAHGEWKYHTSIDEFTDEVVSHKASTIGEYNGNPTIMSAICYPAFDGLAVLWVFPSVHPRSETKWVDMRFRWDDEEIGQAKVLAFPPERLTVVDRVEALHVWIRKAMEHSKLRINYVQRWGSRVTAIYTMKGTQYAIGKVLVACGIEDLLDE